jgi:hypothetical protein
MSGTIPDHRPSLLQYLTAAVHAHRAGVPMPGHAPAAPAARKVPAAPAAKRSPRLVTAEAVDDGLPPSPLVKIAHDAMVAGHIPVAAKVLRVLKDIEISKIAAVTRPAQEGALACLVKSDNTKESTMDLEKQIDDLIAKIDAALGLDKRKQKYTHTHIYDDGYEDVSNPAAHADGDDEEEEPKEDGQDEDDVQKASVNEYLRVDDTSNRPGGLSSSSHGQGGHKFEALSMKLAHEENLPKAEATRQARLRFPDVFASYNKRDMAKSAPMHFDSAVEAEMRKHSLTREVAGQRISQIFGSTLPRRIAKGEDANTRFQKRVYDIADRDGCDLTEATRRARHENANLVRAMNGV